MTERRLRITGEKEMKWSLETRITSSLLSTPSLNNGFELKVGINGDGVSVGWRECGVRGRRRGASDGSFIKIKSFRTPPSSNLLPINANFCSFFPKVKSREARSHDRRYSSKTRAVIL